MKREAIKYHGFVDIHFADLDYYGHVNSKHYLDLIFTTRLNFLANELKTPMESITARGIGFFLTRSALNYRKPIVGLQRVRSTSHVSEVRADRVIVVPFELTNEAGDVLFSDGQIEFAVVDLKTQKITVMPDWGLDLFFHEN